MKAYKGRHPVFVSHTKELEQMLFFLADLAERLRKKGKDTGEKFECLNRVRYMCSEILLRMYAEDTDVILLDELDNWYVRGIVSFVHDVILKDRKKAG